MNVNKSVKNMRLLVDVDDMTKTPVALVAMHPIAFARGDQPTTGLVEIGGDPISMLWAIATHNVPALWELTGQTGTFAQMAEIAAEKILQEIVDVSMGG